MQNDGRFSLVTAMSDLVKVSEALEAMADISLDPAKADSILMELAPQLDTAVDNFKERVDARINFLEFLKVLEAKLKDDVAYLTAKANSCALLQERLKAHTKLLMEQNPTVPFQGTLKKFAIQNNGGKSPIEWTAKLQTANYIVDPTDIEKFPADLGFIKPLTVFQLDKEKFEAYLFSGGTCEAAKALPRGNHLRIK